MQRFREAQPPRSLWAEDSRTGRPFGDLEPPELAIALTARLPLDPDDATQAPSDPAIQRWQLAPLAEAEEPPVPRSGDGTLLGVDLQFEAPFDEAGQARHDPLAGVFAADVDVTVIRVPHEPVAATLKLAIQFIQDEVREQGRERTALRGPFPAPLEQPAIEHTSRQVSPDEPKNPPIRNPRRYPCHQPVVIDPVKGSVGRLPIAVIFPIR